MCLIIKKEAGYSIPANLILLGAEYNPHGWGFMTTSKDEAAKKVFSLTGLHETSKDEQVEKSNKMNSIAKLIRIAAKLKNKTLYVHLRKCTAGSINKANLHPFKIGNSGIYMMHNGTMKLSGIGDDSDTYRFVQVIRPLLEADPNLLYSDSFHILTKSIIGNGMVVFLTPEGREVVIGDRPWITTKTPGIYVSNFYSWKHYKY